eukprot:5700070-Pyramimonas_sp.AAC.1
MRAIADCHQKLTAMVWSLLSTWCHHPSGMKTASPADNSAVSVLQTASCTSRARPGRICQQ